ncbi:MULTISPECIES: hypothetical protein [Methylobacter]|uniref:hypothetical protein n=1 Tax=Methylobacter TaxID=429 RepID=UPI0012ECA0EE|nr:MULTISPECIES: hypothetical protein [Methylobacter]
MVMNKDPDTVQIGFRIQHVFVNPIAKFKFPPDGRCIVWGGRGRFRRLTEITGRGMVVSDGCNQVAFLTLFLNKLIYRRKCAVQRADQNLDFSFLVLA